MATPLFMKQFVNPISTEIEGDLNVTGVISGGIVAGDLSAGDVTALGSTVPHALEERWANVHWAQDFATFAAAVAAANASGKTLMISTPQTITTAIGTITAPVEMVSTGRLVVNAGGSVTLEGAFRSDESFRFDTSGGGTVSFASANSYLFNVKWFGAVGNGSTQNAVAFAACKAAVVSAGGGTMYIPAGTYNHTGTFTYPNNVPFRMQGEMNALTRGGMAHIQWSNNDAQVCIDVPGATSLDDQNCASMSGLDLVGLNSIHEAIVRVTGRKWQMDHVRCYKGQDGIQLNQVYTCSIDSCLGAVQGRDGLRLNDANLIWATRCQFKFAGMNAVHVVIGNTNYFDVDYSGPVNGAGFWVDFGSGNHFRGYYEDNVSGGTDALVGYFGPDTHHNSFEGFLSNSKSIVDLGQDNTYPAGQGIPSVDKVARGGVVNHVNDSSFRLGVTGWAVAGGEGTVSQDAAVGVTTSTSMKVTATGTPGGNCLAFKSLGPTLVAGDEVVLTAMVKANRPLYRQLPFPGGPLHTRFVVQLNNGPTSLDVIGETSSQPYVDEDWRPVVSMFKVKESSAFTGQLQLGFLIAGFEAGDIIWVTDVMYLVNPPKNVQATSIPYVANDLVSGTLAVPLRLPVGDVSSRLRPIDTSALTIQGTAPDGASAVGVVLDASPALSTSGAKVASFRNGGSERAFVDKDGTSTFNGVRVGNSIVTNAAAGQSIVVSGNASNEASATGCKLANNNALTTAGAKAVALYRDFGTNEVFAIGKDGDRKTGAVTFLDDSATPGNRTVNLPHGINAFSAGTAAVAITNSLVTATSRVHVVIQTNDATAILKNVVPGAGSFVVNLTANATGITKFGWEVVN